ncbi:MAG TPA: FAD-dependent oxidoreductase [Burkholderiaceae bacterium]|nr:FAD-dependent oxidoreductase [Burkholderiaceae bacterium]
MKIAIIGSGIAGLGAAHALRDDARITLYESSLRLGGHTNTVDVTLDGVTAGVDTGFLVFNERTYPNLIRLFDELSIPVAESDMSFGVSVALEGGNRLEWAGTDLNAVFAQRRNLLSPRFLGMLHDIVRFNREATRIAQEPGVDDRLSLGEFLDRGRYRAAFRHWYLLPMAAAIWSCPTATMLAYPLATFARFCHNHGLLQVENRPRWFTVQGGARQYVRKIASRIPDIRLGDEVVAVKRDTVSGQVVVKSRHASERYDHVVLACHSDQSLALLADADASERRILEAVKYQRNRALLHIDSALLPHRRSVWSSWNYMSDGGQEPNVSVTYLLNRLQPLPFGTPVMVTLNPITEPDPNKVIAQFDYAHPIFDGAAIAAQQRLADVQGHRRVWLAGAWTGYGFHEDGLKSGLAVAHAILGLANTRRLAA